MIKMNDPTVVEHTSGTAVKDAQAIIEIEISDDSLDACFQVKEPEMSTGSCWDVDALNGLTSPKSYNTPVVDEPCSISDVAVEKDIKENTSKESEGSEKVNNVEDDNNTPSEGYSSEMGLESKLNMEPITSEVHWKVTKEVDYTDIFGMRDDNNINSRNSIEAKNSGLIPIIKVEISAVNPVEGVDEKSMNSTEEIDDNKGDRLVIDETGAPPSADGLIKSENEREEVTNVNNGYYSVPTASLDTAKRKIDEEYSLETIADNSLVSNQTTGINASVSKRSGKRLRPHCVETEGIVKPLELNWMREIVFRATTSANKRAADVYYRSPSGKKLRSLPEVENYLIATHDTTVSPDWFSFRKDKLTNHSNETVRDAFHRSSSASHDVHSETPVIKKIKISSGIKQARTKQKIITPADEETELEAYQKSASRDVPFETPVKKIKNSNGIKQTKTKPKITPAELETDLNPMCSDKCQGYEGHLPDLMCISCYCLFHPRCVGIFSGDEQSDFTCKNCTRERIMRDTNLTHHLLPKSMTNPNGDVHRGGEQILCSQNESLSTRKHQSKVKLKPSTTVSVRQDGNDQRNEPGPSNVVARTPNSASELSSGNCLHSDVSAVQAEDVRPEKKLIMKIGNFVVQSPSSVSVIPISTSASVTLNTEKEAQLYQTPTISTVLNMKPKQLPTSRDTKKQKVPKENSVGSPNHAKSQETTKPKRDWTEMPNNVLLQIFEYLHTKDLFRAKQTCSTWNKAASSPRLWRYVYLQDVKVTNWEKLAEFVQAKGVEFLNMRGMKFLQDSSTMWKDFNAVIPKLMGLSGIVLCKAPASILYRIALKLDKLTYFVSEGIFDAKPEIPNQLRCKLYIGKFHKMTELRTFRMRGIHGLYVPQSVCFGGFSNLSALTHLQELSLTSFTETRASDLEFLALLHSLSALELGDCSDWSDEHFANVGCLTGLKKLRLEYGRFDSESTASALCRALKNLTRLVQLELVLFPIPSEFGEVLSQLKDLQTLIVWPEMNVEGAQNSLRIISALEKVPQLKKCVWGLVAPDINKRLVADRKVNDKFSCIPFFSKYSNLNTGQSELVETNISASQLMEQVRTVLPLSTIRVVMISNSSYTSVRQAVR